MARNRGRNEVNDTETRAEAVRLAIAANPGMPVGELVEAAAKIAAFLGGGVSAQGVPAPHARLPREAIDLICDEYARDTKRSVIAERVRVATGIVVSGAQIQRIACYRSVRRSAAAQAKYPGIRAAHAARAAKRAAEATDKRT